MFAWIEKKSVSVQQKKPESPLDSTNPFLEDDAGEDVGTDKDEDLAKVRGRLAAVFWLSLGQLNFLFL